MSSAFQVMNMDQTAAECAARIRSCRSSGLSVRQWCSDHNISPHTYYRWQRRIFDMVKPQETLMEQLSFLFNEAEVFAAAAEEKKPPRSPHTSGARRTTTTPWTPSQRIFLWSGLSIVWRARSWYVLPAEIP